jgi:hypothetical protein
MKSILASALVGAASASVIAAPAQTSIQFVSGGAPALSITYDASVDTGLQIPGYATTADLAGLEARIAAIEAGIVSAALTSAPTTSAPTEALTTAAPTASQGSTITSGTCCGVDRYIWGDYTYSALNNGIHYQYPAWGRHICAEASVTNLEPTFAQCEAHAVKTNGPSTTVMKAHRDSEVGMCSFWKSRNQWYYNEANTPLPCSEDHPCFCQDPTA